MLDKQYPKSITLRYVALCLNNLGFMVRKTLQKKGLLFIQKQLVLLLIYYIGSFNKYLYLCLVDEV